MEINYYLLDSFIRKVCPNKLDKLIGYLENSDVYETIALPQKTFDADDFSYHSYFKEIHYSWWITPMKTFKKDASLFLTVLPDEPKMALHKILELKVTDKPLDERLSLYLRQTLLNTLDDLALPAEYLPQSIMKPLLTLSKKKLISLIDYLSLYDLAFELKHIVDTNILKPLFSFLEPQEAIFLKKMMKFREPFTLTRMGLDQWDKKEKSLRSSMHKRGIIRLSIALGGENNDFIWHIVHRLDVGRGTMLKKSIKKEISSSIIDNIQANILELIEQENL